jgi:dTDP-4-amino-4,6-dideoxy-D-galactose acyltransferase
MSEALCAFLPWDSAFFGLRIGRVQADSLDADRAQAVRAWATAERIDCAYFLSAAADHASHRHAAHAGFDLVDIRLTLRAPSQPAAAAYDAVRPCRDDDLAQLQAYAAHLHTDSRFFNDGRFPTERCGALYARWLERAAAAPDSRILVAEQDGVPAGYITCEGGSIGLFGVAPFAQGRGLGAQLIRSALAHFASQGVQEVQVITQGKNIAAQRAYQACGFRAAQAELWFHGWFTSR